MKTQEEAEEKRQDKTAAVVKLCDISALRILARRLAPDAVAAEADSWRPSSPGAASGAALERAPGKAAADPKPSAGAAAAKGARPDAPFPEQWKPPPPPGDPGQPPGELVQETNPPKVLVRLWQAMQCTHGGLPHCRAWCTAHPIANAAVGSVIHGKVGGPSLFSTPVNLRRRAPLRCETASWTGRQPLDLSRRASRRAAPRHAHCWAPLRMLHLLYAAPFVDVRQARGGAHRLAVPGLQDPGQHGIEHTWQISSTLHSGPRFQHKLDVRAEGPGVGHLWRQVRADAVVSYQPTLLQRLPPVAITTLSRAEASVAADQPAAGSAAVALCCA
jgi:hypothetical protein